MSDNKLLENILAAQVLSLAKQLKTEKATRGISNTSDFIDDAALLIKKEKNRILELLQI